MLKKEDTGEWSTNKLMNLLILKRIFSKHNYNIKLNNRLIVIGYDASTNK